MRIAVCFSGQERVWKHCYKHAVNFFSGDYQVDFFGHTWNMNTHKIKPEDNRYCGYLEEPVNVAELNQIAQEINFVEFQITEFNPESPYYVSLFHSAFLANHMKRQHEMEQGFFYDLVIKTRYDLVYEPGTKFKPSLLMTSQKKTHNYTPQLDLFCNHYQRFGIEYNRINVWDMMYYGSSWAMDAISDIFWEARKSISVKLDDFLNVGPGVRLDEFGNRYNLRFYTQPGLQLIYRHSAAPADPDRDFDLIKQHHDNIYK